MAKRKARTRKRRGRAWTRTKGQVRRQLGKTGRAARKALSKVTP